jgi:cytidine deaminase
MRATNKRALSLKRSHHPKWPENDEPRFPKTIPKRLLAAAARARHTAVAPYSHFRVGAALLTRQGAIFAGANVESASYGLTCCAERVALFKALTAGAREFAAIAVVARVAGGPSPCGACRQLLAEYAPRAIVWLADSRNTRTAREFSVRELLPAPFVTVPVKSN